MQEFPPLLIQHGLMSRASCELPEIFIVRRYDLSERFPEFLPLITAVRYFSEARGQPAIAKRLVGPFYEILSAIVVFEALQRERWNQDG